MKIYVVFDSTVIDEWLLYGITVEKIDIILKAQEIRRQWQKPSEYSAFIAMLLDEIRTDALGNLVYYNTLSVL